MECPSQFTKELQCMYSQNPMISASCVVHAQASLSNIHQAMTEYLLNDSPLSSSHSPHAVSYTVLTVLQFMM